MPWTASHIDDDKLLATPAPRVVTVSSMAHKVGRINFEDLQSDRSYWRWPRYGQSKLANTLCAATADIPGGSFVGPDGLQEIRGHPTLVKPTRAARNPQTAPSMGGLRGADRRTV